MGTCFRCGKTAPRGIYTRDRSPAGHVCRACDQEAVEVHRRKALDLVERAQQAMSHATEQLSPINYGFPAMRRLQVFYNRIHAEWYRLKDVNHARWSMDDSYWTNRFLEHEKAVAAAGAVRKEGEDGQR